MTEANFVSFHDQQVHVHILPTAKYRTRHLSMKVARPLSREQLTETALLPYLWLEGTKTHPTALDLTRYSETLYGSSIRTGIGKRGIAQVAEVAGSCPEESRFADATGVFEQLTNLATEVLMDSARDATGFLGDHVKREKALHKHRLTNAFDDKIAYSLERCVEEVCRGDVTGLPRLGYLEDIDSMTPETLWNAHQDLMEQADIHIYLIGDFAEPARVSEHFLASLSRRLPTRKQPGASRTEALELRMGDVRRVEEAQNVSQGKLNLGFRTGVSYGDPNYFALLVCNGILGGFPHSKLFMNVREKASLAYYASSRLDGLTGVITVQTGIEIDNYAQALAIVQEQVAALKAGQITSDELEFTKRGLRNQYLQLMDQPTTLTDIHFSGVLSGVNRSITSILQGIENVKIDDVAAVAQQIHLDTIYFLRNQEVNTAYAADNV
jgi:predicted Zn-dependent peptidase